MMNQISFQYPYLLFLLLAIPLLILFRYRFDKRIHADFLYSDLSQFSSARKTWRLRLRRLPDYLR